MFLTSPDSQIGSQIGTSVSWDLFHPLGPESVFLSHNLHLTQDKRPQIVEECRNTRLGSATLHVLQASETSPIPGRGDIVFDYWSEDGLIDLKKIKRVIFFSHGFGEGVQFTDHRIDLTRVHTRQGFGKVVEPMIDSLTEKNMQDDTLLVFIRLPGYDGSNYELDKSSLQAKLASSGLKIPEYYHRGSIHTIAVAQIELANFFKNHAPGLEQMIHYASSMGSQSIIKALGDDLPGTVIAHSPGCAEVLQQILRVHAAVPLSVVEMERRIRSTQILRDPIHFIMGILNPALTKTTTVLMGTKIDKFCQNAISATKAETILANMVSMFHDLTTNNLSNLLSRLTPEQITRLQIVAAGSDEVVDTKRVKKICNTQQVSCIDKPELTHGPERDNPQAVVDTVMQFV